MCHFSFTVISGALFVSARRYDSNMLANSREELVEVFDALDAELDRLDEDAARQRAQVLTQTAAATDTHGPPPDHNDDPPPF